MKYDQPTHTMGMQMNFGMALSALKQGQKVARTGWNGKGLWLEMQTPDAHSKMTLPYIFMSYPDDAQNTPGARVPWLASQTDMLAEDWTVLVTIVAELKDTLKISPNGYITDCISKPVVKEPIPTIGRRIWYYPSNRDNQIATLDVADPVDAGIVYVHKDGTVNLSITDHFGRISYRGNVKIVPRHTPGLPEVGYARWMPYQVKAETSRSSVAEVKPQDESTSGTFSGHDIANTHRDGFAAGVASTKPTTNRVTPEQIEALMERVNYRASPRDENRTSTLVLAYLDDKFLLATGHSACVDPANYDRALGVRLAKEDAISKARKKLWRLEGYALYKALQA